MNSLSTTTTKATVIKVIFLTIFLIAVIYVQTQIYKLGDKPKKVGPIPYTVTKIHMGTLFTIIIAEKRPQKELQGAVTRAFDVIHQLDKKYSTYKKDSLISRINADAGKKATSIDNETYQLIQFATNISKLSKGAFDITFKSFDKIWKLNPEKFTLPDKETILRGKISINYRNLHLNKEEQEFKIFINNEYTQIGMGAYVKGYAIDQAALSLKNQGINNFIINGGGDIYFAGTKFGTHWLTGIQHPRKGRGELLANIPIDKNMALVTSGDYEKFVIHQGIRYHHIIDPRTGYPARGLISVTVLHPSAMTADALATSIFVLGLKEGMKLINNFPDIQALLIDDQGEFHGTKELITKLEKVNNIEKTSL